MVNDACRTGPLIWGMLPKVARREHSMSSEEYQMRLTGVQSLGVSRMSEGVLCSKSGGLLEGSPWNSMVPGNCGGSIIQQLSQFSRRLLAERDLRLVGIAEFEAETAASIGDHFFDVLQVNQVTAMSSEEAAAGKPLL